MTRGMQMLRKIGEGYTEIHKDEKDWFLIKKRQDKCFFGFEF